MKQQEQKELLLHIATDPRQRKHHKRFQRWIEDDWARKLPRWGMRSFDKGERCNSCGYSTRDSKGLNNNTNGHHSSTRRCSGLQFLVRKLMPWLSKVESRSLLEQTTRPGWMEKSWCMPWKLEWLHWKLLKPVELQVLGSTFSARVGTVERRLRCGTYRCVFKSIGRYICFVRCRQHYSCLERGKTFKAPVRCFNVSLSVSTQAFICSSNKPHMFNLQILEADLMWANYIWVVAGSWR